MAPKRAAGKNLTPDQFKQPLESRALDDTVDKISKKLKADHGMASRILRIIEAGCFNKEEAIEEVKLPPSCNKFRLVHKDTLAEIILGAGVPWLAGRGCSPADQQGGEHQVET